MSIKVEIVDSLASVSSEQWDALVGDMPLLRHAFLYAFEQSESVGLETGWQPCPLLLKDADQLIGAMPLYLKYHSYGEYVFDWSWADAYEQNGLAYYPKLLSAIPFTPITSPRLLTHTSELQSLMVSGLHKLMEAQNFSSVHVNFPDENSEKAFKDAGWLRREGVQFRWENKGYTSFDDFLQSLSQPKRKKIRQERKKIAANEVTCRTIKGEDITEAEWSFFYQCYQQTYLEHHSTPYLNLAFFLQIAQSMPGNIVLFIAYQNKKPIASAFNIYQGEAMYGRYWGAIQYVPNLHFELCYYQAQAFCIREGIRFFEGGAQGEHKLARGFSPRPTCSYHLIAQPDFAHAIKTAVDQEKNGMAAYVSELEVRSPYKHASK